MSDETPPTLLARIGTWFGRKPSTDLAPGEVRRAKPDVGMVLNSVQQGFGTLTELMDGIRTNLRENSEQQRELIQHLSRLPDVANALPEQQKAHTEALLTIREQLVAQHEAQGRLGDILESLHETGSAQREAMTELGTRMESMRATDEKIADNLGQVGTAMSDVSKSSEMSTRVLAEMRDGANSRDRDLERVLHRQGQRFTVMLAVAIVLSVAALVAVSVIGFLMITRAR